MKNRIVPKRFFEAGADMKIAITRLIAFAAFGIAALIASEASALALTGVYARKIHGTAGSFDLPIDTTPTLSGAVTVEGRAASSHVIVFQFDDTITATGSANVVDGFGPIGTASTSITGAMNLPPNNEVSVTLPGISNNKRISISLTQVNGLLDVSPVSIGFLVGDVNNSRNVNSIDVSQVKARAGQPTAGTSYWHDLNLSGQINAADIAGVKSRVGRTLNAPTEFELLIVKAGTGSGSVTAAAGINCGNVCAVNLAQNTAVTVTATANVGSTFAGWSGACTGVAMTSMFVVAANSACTANFAINTFLVTPSAGANGSIAPSTVQTIGYGATTTFTVTPNMGFVASVGGTCGGTLVATTYTTNPITAACTVSATFIPSIAPLVLYTDIQSGPNTGGENGDGIYLSIFGKNFGTSGLGTTTKVFINNVEVTRYLSLGPSRGRTDIQQLTVQIGALGNPTPGTSLPIRVSVNGANSNTDQTFIVNPGIIYFVSLTGSDATGAPGAITNPYRSVQKPGTGINGVAGCPSSSGLQSVAAAGVWGLVREGDFIVMRGGTWNDLGKDAYFLHTINKSGKAPTGAVNTGPITIMGFPGETAFINRANTIGDNQPGGAITSADSARQLLGCGASINLTNLKIESGFNDGPIGIFNGHTNPVNINWRVVNNEMTAVTCNISTKCRAGGIVGSGFGHVWLGNHVHDINDMPDASTSFENHGFYIEENGSFEIAYNRIERIFGGNGIQTFCGGSCSINNLSFHHNVINGVGKHGINIADVVANLRIYNNVIMNTDIAGIRFKSNNMVGAKVFNNTFFNSDLLNGNSPFRSVLMNDGTLLAGSLEIRNNIFVPGNANRNFEGGDSNFASVAATMSHNLRFNGTGTATGISNQSSNPLFISTTAGAENLRLQSMSSGAYCNGTNTVAAIVTNDFDTADSLLSPIPRPLGGCFSIGAFEFH